MIEIFTDGSCYYKDRIGAWSFVVSKDGEIIFEDFNHINDTTSARMEMTAFLEALKYIKKNKIKKVNIITDYQNVCDFFEKLWYITWGEIDYYGVKNRDLWEEILRTYWQIEGKVIIQKVKGHTGVELNERADYLAGVCRKILTGKIK